MGESPRGGGLRQKEVRSESEGSCVTRGLGDSVTHEQAVARYPDFSRRYPSRLFLRIGVRVLAGWLRFIRCASL